MTFLCPNQVQYDELMTSKRIMGNAQGERGLTQKRTVENFTVEQRMSHDAPAGRSAGR